MEIKETERRVIAKPVASRPSSSTFRSFSELLAGAINGSPSRESAEPTVTPIRPNTIRLKPTANRPPVGIVSSQVEVCGAAVCNSSDKGSKSDIKSNVVYRPLAKLVSKSTVSLLANLGNSNISQEAPAQIEAHVQPPKPVNYNFRTSSSSNIHQNYQSQPERAKTSEYIEDDQKSLPPTSNSDRPSYDGYNWRKYGQKQVKGSEYPRSYYKCTHPNCPVKKKVERSLDGQIAEIVYKGEHNHSKPQPPKRNTPVAQGQALVSDGNAQDPNIPIWYNQLNVINEDCEDRTENRNEIGLSGKAPLSYDPVIARAVNNCVTTLENSCGLSGDCEEGSKGLEADDDEPRSKRRKNEIQPNERGLSGEGVKEPRILMQNSTDSEIIGDGFRWRKYGQKVVKGNPYPRSYYRCTSIKCNVRKHVERASDDPRAFITTYEGKHNHDRPIKNSNQVASAEPDSHLAPTSSKDLK